MALNFPASPTDGQIYEGYQWDAAKGVWVSGRYSEYRPASTDIPGIAEIATLSEVLDGTDDTKIVSPLGLRGSVYAQFIPSGANLNDYLTPGNYHQNTNAGAAAGTNYPASVAGLLEVIENSQQTFLYQRYTTYRLDANVWHRSFYAGSWSAWKRLLNVGEAGTVRAAATGTYSSATDLATGTGVSISVTFPAGRFSTVPAVTLNPTVSGRIQCAALNITTSGFTARLDNFSGASATDRDFNWIAIETW